MFLSLSYKFIFKKVFLNFIREYIERKNFFFSENQIFNKYFFMKHKKNIYVMHEYFYKVYKQGSSKSQLELIFLITRYL